MDCLSLFRDTLHETRLDRKLCGRKRQSFAGEFSRNAVDFDAPEDMQFLNIDKESHLPATARCPETYGEVFIPGTVPTTFCPLHGQSVSEAIESGFGAAGRGVGGALKTVGRVFSGIFGRNDAPQR